jgi:hypothetical protein
MNNVFFSDGIHLVQNGIYRGRLLVLVPKIPLVSDQRVVKGKLEAQGFTDVTFFDKNALPPDWPADQTGDPSSGGQWTAYAQGRFTLTDRVIPTSELGSNVTLYGMWLQQAPPGVQPAPPGPGPDPRPQPDLPPLPPLPEKQSMIGPAIASAAGVALGFAAAKFLARKKVPA